MVVRPIRVRRLGPGHPLPCSIPSVLRQKGCSWPSQMRIMPALLEPTKTTILRRVFTSLRTTVARFQNNPGTVKLWESPRQSRGVSHWTNTCSGLRNRRPSASVHLRQTSEQLCRRLHTDGRASKTTVPDS